MPVIVDDNDDSLYWIGDSEKGGWILTDPKGHKNWSTEVNKDNSGKYKPLVKIFKWWRRVDCPKDVRYPKGITLEKIVADNIGDASKSTEDLLIETIENIIGNYKTDYSDKGLVPFLQDPSDKTPDNDLLDGYSNNDFSDFIDLLVEHSDLLNNEGTGNDVWKKILGDEFPSEANKKSNKNALRCRLANHREKPYWPMSHGGAAFITLTVKNRYGETVEYNNNGDRGGFEESDYGDYGKKESTTYTGSHSVQCFIIKKGICVAKSRDFIINIC